MITKDNFKLFYDKFIRTIIELMITFINTEELPKSFKKVSKKRITGKIDKSSVIIELRDNNIYKASIKDGKVHVLSFTNKITKNV